MSVHGFHPNSNRVTPTMSSSYPVKMSKIWGIKKNVIYFGVFTDSHSEVQLWVTYNSNDWPWISTKFGMKHSHCTLIHPCEYEQNLRNQKISPLYLAFFSHKKFAKYHFYTLCTKYLKNYHKNGLSHLMRHWLHTQLQSEWTHIRVSSTSSKQVISQKPCELCI